MRLVEIILFLMPLACWLLWLRLARRPGPAPVILASMAAALLALGALLGWLAVSQSAPPGSVYVPARSEGGRIVPGGSVPK